MSKNKSERKACKDINRYKRLLRKRLCCLASCGRGLPSIYSLDTDSVQFPQFMGRSPLYLQRYCPSVGLVYSGIQLISTDDEGNTSSVDIRPRIPRKIKRGRS